MKIHHLLLTLVLACGTLIGQTAPNQTSTDSHQQHHPSTSPQSGNQQMGAMEMGTSQSGMRGMAAMKADMQQMQSQIERMRADAQNVQDPNTRAALMQNVAIWEQFLNRMQSHMQMMGGAHGMMGQGQSASNSGGCPMMQGQPQGKNPPPPHP